MVNGKACNLGGLQDYLDEKCNTKPAGEIAASVSDPNNLPLTDQQGRILCDAGCRPEQDQISDFISQIFEHNPYARVDSNIQVD